MLTTILVISIGCQIVAAVLAFRLIPLTGKAFPWMCVILALSLMVFRRLIPLYEYITGNSLAILPLTVEFLGLLISICWTLSFLTAIPIIRKIRDSEQRALYNEGRYRAFFNNANDALMVIDCQNGNVIEINSVAVELYGYSNQEVQGKHLSLFSAEPDKTTSSALKKDLYVPLRYHKKKSGEIFPVEIKVSHFMDGEHKVAVAIIHDLTERLKQEQALRESEERLREASRLQSTATLAGGIAHTFNNLMMGVIGNVELLEVELGTENSHSDLLTEINQAAWRAAELSEQLLAYAQGGRYTPKVIDTRAEIENIFESSFHTIPKRVSIKLDLEQDLGKIKADPTQFRQILVNLVTNAVESIEGEGWIRVHACNLDVQNGSKIPVELPQGSYVFLCIEDNGCGMTDEVRKHIYEPFFSTKFQGRGLGASAVYGIVKNHGGGIQVTSHPKGGTRICVYLPRFIEPVMVPPVEVPPLSESGLSILLVEDERTVSDIVKKMLERQGHTVTTARNGREGMDFITNQPQGHFHLVILDLEMPVMDGEEFFNRLLAFHPRPKVLLCTAYDLGPRALSLIGQGADGFIQKPFKSEDIELRIKQIFTKDVPAGSENPVST